MARCEPIATASYSARSTALPASCSNMGVVKGDRVTIYMGRVPELVIAMLACAKIGAPHSVVYGGFSVEALHARIEDAQSRVLITCDGAYLRGQIVELKKIADEALQRAPSTTTVITVRRTGHDVQMMAGRDFLVSRTDGPAFCRAYHADRGHGRRGHALSALHLRHHRHTQGRGPHPRRLPGGHQRHPQVGIRHQGGGHLVVRGRPRLDHGPQLHRLRSADPGRDERDL